MAGYCIELFKYMQIDQNFSKRKRLIESRKNVQKDDRNIRNFLAYGEFDRIAFTEIRKFPRFRDVSEKAKSWVGDRQIILAYEIGENIQALDGVVFQNDNFYEKGKGGQVLSDKLFIGITILQFKESQSLREEKKDLDSFLRRCKENILEIVSQEKSDVKCSVLGTLGSFGIVILWLSDQFVDVLNLVTVIKNTNVGQRADSVDGSNSIFLSAYTVFAKNHPTENEGKYKKRNKMEEVKGTAVMHLTLKQGFSSEIREELKRATDKTTYLHCVGEYDVLWKMDAHKALEIVENNGSDSPLYYVNDFYKKYVLQSSLLLCEDIKSVLSDGHQNSASAENYANLKESDEKYRPELDDIQREYSELRNELKIHFPHTAGMVDTLDLLYCDYIYKISVASNEMWVEIYSYQILNILKSIRTLLSKMYRKELQNSNALRTINRLLTDFERQIFHIAESNNLIMTIPSCQLRFSGQNNLVLYAYFGIMKKVLEFVYQNQTVNKQAEIIPLIVSELVPKIESTLYEPIAYNEGEQSSDGDDKSRIVTINLSMTSLFDPVSYYPYLYHEIFHYIVPKDRHVRNMLYKCLISMEFLRRIIAVNIKHRFAERSIPVENINNLLSVYLNKYVMQYVYMDTVKAFIERNQTEKNENESNIEIHRQSMTFNELFNDFYRKWVKWINGMPVNERNPIYAFFCTVYSGKNELLGNIRTFFREEKIKDKNLIQTAIEVAEDFFSAIDGIINNKEPESAAIGFHDMLSTFEEEDILDIDRMVTGIREASADIAMVAITGMDFDEYLILFTKIKKELMLEPDSDNIDPQDVIRIGMILNRLYEEEMDVSLLINVFASFRDSFVGMYQGLFYNPPKEREIDQWERICQDADRWFKYWKKCYENYLRRYSVYSPFLREIYRGLLISVDVSVDKELDSFTQINSDGKYWKKYAKIIRERGNVIADLKREKNSNSAKRDEILSDFDNQIFKVNIELIQGFQYQNDFQKINGIRNDRYDSKKAQNYEMPELQISDELMIDSGKFHVHPAGKTYRYCYKADDIKNLSDAIDEAVKNLKKSCEIVLGKGDYPIWYRGQQSSNYILLPSIMRKYKNKKAKVAEPKTFSLVNMIRKEYEEFRFRADGTSETIDRAAYSYSDYIALMQHYSVASNFLDWTEDALSSLYFALEGFLDDQKNKVAEDAALYLFSPALYNEARIRMLKECEKFQDCRTPLEKDILANRQGGIPNLSVDYNEKLYRMYLLGAEEYGNNNYIKFDGEREDKMFFYLPVAIYTSRLNKRIQAQYGTFLAYNIYTSPDANDEFSYMSLERIQERYLELAKDEKNVYPFLYKIEIRESSRAKLADWVSAFGMSKERCYPELENIGVRIMR